MLALLQNLAVDIRLFIDCIIVWNGIILRMLLYIEKLFSWESCLHVGDLWSFFLNFFIYVTLSLESQCRNELYITPGVIF